MIYLFGQVIIGYKDACEAIIDHTHLCRDFRPKLGYHKTLGFKVDDSTNQRLHQSYTYHWTLLVDVGVVIQHYTCIQRLQRI